MPDAPSFELWTPARQKLHKYIEAVDSSLAPLYREAVRMIETTPAAGEDRLRLALIGHCIRELINSLPDALGDVPGALRGGQNDDSALSKFDQAVMKWRRRLDTDAADVAAIAPNATVEIPGHLLTAVEQLAESRQNGTARRLSRDSFAILGHVDVTSPVLSTWSAARDFFMDSTHLDRQFKLRDGSGSLPTQAEILHHLELIEATLHVRFGRFFDSIHSIEDLLAEANLQCVAPPVYRAPEPSLIERVLARLGTLQLHRAFFSRLDNPLWIAPLHERKLFSNPPTVQTLDDGRRMVDPWPQLDYLVRMAADDPTTVADVLHPVADADNPWIRRGIVEIAASAPAEIACSFAKKIGGWRNAGKAELVRASDLVRLIETLCAAGLDEGTALAEAYYRPFAKPAHPGAEEPVVGIDPYEHGTTLPRIARALGKQATKILVFWLEDYQRFSVEYELEPGTDHSPFWRPRIAPRTGLGSHPMGDALIDALREASYEQAMTDPLDAVTTLLSGRQPVIHRIALDVIAEILESAEDTTQPAAFAVPFSDIAESADALMQSRFLDVPYRTEFSRFAVALAAREPEFPSKRLEAALVEAESAAAAKYQQSLEDAGVPAPEAEAKTSAYTDRWVQRLLAGIGPQNLPSTLVERLHALDRVLGTLDKPTLPALELAPLTGFPSPLTHEEMEAMPDHALLEHLRSWHPNPNEWFGPSHHGQNLELVQAVQASPGRFAHDLGSLRSLRPIYIRGIFEGWQKSLAEGHATHPDNLLSALAWAAELDDEYVFAVEGDEHEDDPGYKLLKIETVRLVHTLLGLAAKKTVKLTDVQWAKAESVLETLALNPDPGPSSNNEFQTGESDPFEASFTRIRPQAIRALTVLAAFTPNPDVRTAALDFLTGRITVDDSYATAAAFGEGLGHLATASPDWARAQTPLLFEPTGSQAPWRRIALITALSTHQVAPKTLELLYQPMVYTLGQGRPTTSVEERLEALVGRWATLGYVFGIIDVNDRLLTGFYEQAPVNLRKDAIGHLGWLLMRSNEVPLERLSRAMSLVDWRIDHVRSQPNDHGELDDFHWYVRAEQLSSGWWGPRLATVCEISPSFVGKGMMGERIASVSRDHPGETLTALELLLSRRPADQPLDWDLTENAAPEVIAACLDAPDAELSERATKLMDRLGSMGLLDIEGRVQGRRRSP